MTRVDWTEPALGDLAKIADYVANHNPMAARALVARLIKAGDDLRAFPNRGRPRDGCKELTVVPPYIPVYRVNSEVIEVLRVWHGARRRA